MREDPAQMIYVWRVYHLSDLELHLCTRLRCSTTDHNAAPMVSRQLLVDVGIADEQAYAGAKC